MTSVISWFSITITNTWLKFGRAAGDGVGLGVGAGVGVGVGVGVGAGVGLGLELDARKVAMIPLVHAEAVNVWVAVYVPVALTTMLLRFDSLLGLVSSLLISVKPLGAPQLCVAEPWLTPKPARTISLVAVVAALVLTDWLLTAVVALLADPVVSRVSVAPTSAML